MAAAAQSDMLLPSFEHHPSSAVTLLVGPDEQPMLAYEYHITQASEFFRVTLKKQWLEGQTRIIKLPEAEPATMAHYLTYLYERSLPTHKLTKDVVATIGLSQEP